MFPKPETIDAIAKALNIKPAQLFEEQGCPKNIISFNKEEFIKEITSELYEQLNESMLEYLKNKV